MIKPLFLLDSYALIYRAYFAFLTRPLRNRGGENISALFGFGRTVTALLANKKPKVIAAVFDSVGPTFRHTIFPAYKGTREKAPEDLHAQIPLVERLLSALGIPALRVDGYEADDIIATLVAQCRAQGRPCYIVSGDKDLLQLVGENVYELRPLKRPVSFENSFVSAREDEEKEEPKGGVSPLSGFELIDAAAVQREWGIKPSAILDYLSLTGDLSDNVPGVKGIGAKTAVKLLLRYESLDAIYENLPGIGGAIGKKLGDNRENAYLSRKLITLCEETPLPFSSIDEIESRTIDYGAGAEFLAEKEIRTIARDLAKLGGIEAPVSSEARKEAEREREAEAAHTAPEALFSPAVPGSPGGPASGVYRCVLDVKELQELLDKARAQGFFALDFETTSLDTEKAQAVGFSIALKPEEAFYIPLLPHGPIRSGAFLPTKLAQPLLAAVLALPDMVVVAHNAKFDYKIAKTWGITEWNARIFDTMIAAWLNEPDLESYSLEKTAYALLNYTVCLTYKNIVPKGETFQSVPLETACRYSAEDSDITLRLREYFLSKNALAGDLGVLFYDIEMPLLPILADMEARGIRIDTKQLKEYGDRIGKELSSIQYEVWEMAGHSFNLSSPRQLQDVLFIERKLKPAKKTATGWSTDMSVLEELAKDDAVCRKVLRYRTLQKLKSTYVDALCCLADQNERLHTTLFQAGTATGRLSSRDPNLQNIPIREEEGRYIRDAFTARDGSLLISADYSQIELVVLAHLSGDAELCAAFKSGEDVHRRTAALIFGIPPDSVSAAQRRVAKTINFGVMYGMSAFRLAGDLEISRAQALDFIKTYFKTYAGVSNFIDNLIKETEETGYVTTLFGRRRRIRQINSKNKLEKAAAERVAVNTPIQGSAADIVKKAMLDLDRELHAEGSAARLLLQVHDELILECPQEGAEDAAKLVRRVMENTVKLTVPLRVSVETGPRWGSFH